MSRLKFLILVAGSVVLGACANLLDPAAAVVYGTKIPVEEVVEGVDRFAQTQEFERLSQQGDPKAIRRQFEQGFLSQLIRRAVLEPKAEGLGVEVTRDELQARIDEIQDDFPSPSAFAEALKEQGLDMEQLRQLVADSLLEEELREKVTAEAAPTETELRDFYAAHEADYLQYHAQHILVDNANLANVVRRQILAEPRNKQEAKFEELAKDFSTDDSNAKRGGDLGFSTPGDFVPPFEAALEKLSVEQISKPVKTQFGWHVIRLIDRGTQPFDEVRGEIEQQLAVDTEQRVWEDWLAAAYEEAEVKVNPRYGELDLESGQVIDATAEDIPAGEVPSPDVSPSVPVGG